MKCVIQTSNGVCFHFMYYTIRYSKPVMKFMANFLTFVMDLSTKNHPLFQAHPSSLQLIVYFDELEVCNPLGSHSGVHKLGKSIHCF